MSAPNWLSTVAGINELIAKKSYAQAIELLSAQLQQQGKNERLRLQLAHVQALAGQKDAAVAVLESLADDLAADGFAAKAIAALKKVQKLAPTRPGVEEKLSDLINGRPPKPPERWVDSGPTPELGIEIGYEPWAVSVTAGGELTPPAPRELGPAAAPATRSGSAVESPLFRGLSREETLAIIRGLQLRSVGPGSILVTEGEPGDSLFVLTSGVCRAYIRNPAGHNVEVRELREGNFFGEISILSAKPRTATITTVTPCELLELDRNSLDTITAQHPKVREVLQEFHDQRKDSTIEAAIRGMRS